MLLHLHPCTHCHIALPPACHGSQPMLIHMHPYTHCHIAPRPVGRGQFSECPPHPISRVCGPEGAVAPASLRGTEASSTAWCLLVALELFLPSLHGRWVQLMRALADCEPRPMVCKGRLEGCVGITSEPWCIAVFKGPRPSSLCAARGGSACCRLCWPW